MTELSEMPDRYRAPALDKGLDIIELLASQPKGLTRAEIVRAMGKGPSEIYRMLERLVARGYVNRSLEGDRYELSLKLFELGTCHPPLRRLTSQALPLMDRFTLDTLQSCHLVVADAGFGLVVAQASPPDTWEFRVRLGAQLDLLATGSGQTLLAFQSAERRTALLHLWRSPEKTAQLATLQPALERMREQGYRIGESHQLSGVTDVSVPILNHERSAIAVITSAYTNRIDHAGTQDLMELCQRLQAIAQQLSLGL